MAAAVMRLAFMGTPDFAVPTLRALAGAGHEIAAVYTQPPRPAGRGKKPRPSPVARAAEGLGLPVRTPVSFKDPAVQDAFAALNADAAVVVAYGLILRQATLDAPRLGCFNLHASLLPRWRGAAPIQRALMAGDAVTGACVMRMTLGLDEGPVVSRLETPIGPDDTGATLHDRLAAQGAPLMVEALAAIADGRAEAAAQPSDGVLYAAKIDKAEARINWSAPAAAVDRQIRGLSPFPGAWFEAAGEKGPERVKALLSVAEPAAGARSAAPGQALDDRLLIACGDGAAVRLLTVQRAGKGAAPAADFLRGFPIKPGERLL